jgi:hypothetical protein
VTKLRPGETATPSVRLTLQSQPSAPAGLYTLGVLVHSRYRQDVSRCEELLLTVAPVDKVTVLIEPEVATGGRSALYTVDVTNEGNTPVRLRLASTDPERRVASSFDPAALQLQPGAAARAILTVRAPVPWNKEKQRTLKVEATGAGAGGHATATFTQRPRFASKLTRMAGILGAVLVLAAAIVGAGLIARRTGAASDLGSRAANGNATGAPATGQPSSPPAATASPTQAASASPSAAATTAAPGPLLVDLTRPGGRPATGVLPSDAFRQQGILLSGLPDRDGPAECADATAVAVRSDARGSFVTAARPGNPAACNQVPVQIRFIRPAGSAEVVLGGTGNRRMEVVFRDLSRTVQKELKAGDDGRRGGIDFVLIRGLPADLNAGAPPAAVRTVRFTPLGG